MDTDADFRFDDFVFTQILLMAVAFNITKILKHDAM